MKDGKRQDAVLSVRMTEELREHFRDFCEARQINPAAFVRAALKDRMAKIEAAEACQKIA